MRMLLFAWLLPLTATVCASEPLQLQLAGHRLHAEYAHTPAERQRGLMGRTELAADSGMLFRFDELRPHCLWMKDTPLPLSAAFLDEHGVIVDLLDLEPLDETIRCSRRPARYALEVNRGWFEARAISRGMRVEGLLGR